MDTYPPEFAIHLQPTLVVSGLTTAEDASHQADVGPPQVNSDIPPPPPPRPGTQGSKTGLAVQKAVLLQAMLSRNNVSYWDNTKGLAGSLFYVIPEQATYNLPPTRRSLQQTNQLHLAQQSYSPTVPSSPLYPDGLITPLWIRRHREQIPSVFIAVVDLWDRESIAGNADNGQRGYSDKGPLGVVDPMERDHDTTLAQDLLERRKASQERGVKFAGVIMLQRSHMEDPSIEDRLNFVRKSAGLDIKNSFYVLPPSNSQEISDFAVNLQRSQYEGSMNYYKEQIKRHKKKRSNLPSTTASVRPGQQPNIGASQQAQQQTLSVQGWMFRYDFKMGMFSECKQDIDNAVKFYESAYGLLIDMFAVTSTITPGTPGLQARTKRWAEAKVLADCLCLKICKFHLYLDAPSTALFIFRRHLIVFKGFSESWRMGDDSFEYWAWLGKQYRVFGDLLDIGVKAGFKLPVPSPGSVVYGSFAGMTEGSKDLNKFSGIGVGNGVTGFGIGPSGDAYVYGGSVGGGRGGGTHGPGAGVNPMLVLQHAGYFYHQSADCSVQRRLRFEMAEEAYPDSSVAPVPTSSKPYPPTLQSMNAERAIDHLSLTIELLTKSYEQFKRHKAGRMTLFLASEIAGTYYTAGKFEMALKFFERIGKTYRKEGWNLILTSILKWSIQCAKELGYWENVVEYLIEMMSPDMPATEAKRSSVFDELVSILHTDIHPANSSLHKPLVLSMPQINSFVSCAVQFQTKQAFVASASKFQLQLSTQGGQGALPKSFRLSYVLVEFSDPNLNHRFEDLRSLDQIEVQDSEGVSMKDRTGRIIEWIDCNRCTFDTQSKTWKTSVGLDISPHSTKVIEGVIMPETEQTVQVVKITLGIVTEHWSVALEHPMTDIDQDGDQAGSQHSFMPLQKDPPRRQWLEASRVSDDAGSSVKLKFKQLDKGTKHAPLLRVVPRESKVEIQTLFKSPAYLDEFFPVVIKVRNGEAFPVAMEMDVELQPIDPSIESLDSIVLDPNAALMSLTAGSFHASQTIHGIRLSKAGTSPGSDNVAQELAVGEWAEQTIFVKALEIPTPRTIVCKVRYEVSLENEQKKTSTEKQHVFRVQFIPPFDAIVDYTPQLAHIPEAKATQESEFTLAPILQSNVVDEKYGAVTVPALTHTEVYLMSTRVNNEGPWPVQVKEVKLVIGPESNILPEPGTGGRDRTAGGIGGLSRSHSISRMRDRKKSLQEVGIRIELLEDSSVGLDSHSGEGNGESDIRPWHPGNLRTFNHLVRVTAADLDMAPEQVEVGYLRIQWRR
ncbi:MAG: Foie gras liver health family 1-domain-containing protein [Linnemannia gamsii]|nr:MAG: Foie gras liver health family 1-domain-containing protein [Linnemannia gamsii]